MDFEILAEIACVDARRIGGEDESTPPKPKGAPTPIRTSFAAASATRRTTTISAPTAAIAARPVRSVRVRPRAVARATSPAAIDATATSAGMSESTIDPEQPELGDRGNEGTEGQGRSGEDDDASQQKAGRGAPSYAAIDSLLLLVMSASPNSECTPAVSVAVIQRSCISSHPFKLRSHGRYPGARGAGRQRASNSVRSALLVRCRGSSYGQSNNMRGRDG